MLVRERYTRKQTVQRQAHFYNYELYFLFTNPTRFRKETLHLVSIIRFTGKF